MISAVGEKAISEMESSGPWTWRSCERSTVVDWLGLKPAVAEFEKRDMVDGGRARGLKK